mmetsp:Transcript_125428/g.351259  ORF Transcript_125428/g.351259 Transcript_125428/m.351259 type:complete len:622 (-) Transcript_125428:282-2147(-)
MEVRELHVTTFRGERVAEDEDVLRPDVAVDPARVVHFGEPAQDLGQELHLQPVRHARNACGEHPALLLDHAVEKVRVRGLQRQEVRRLAAADAVAPRGQEADDVAAAEELEGGDLVRRPPRLVDVQRVDLLDHHAVTRLVDLRRHPLPRLRPRSGLHLPDGLRWDDEAVARGGDPLGPLEGLLRLGAVGHRAREHPPHEPRQRGVAALQVLETLVNGEVCPIPIRPAVLQGQGDVLGDLPGQQLEGEHARGPHVRLADVAAAMSHLGRRVQPVVGELPDVDGVERRRGAQAAQLRVAALGGGAVAEDQDVVWGEVRVQPAGALHLLQAAQDLDEHADFVGHRHLGGSIRPDHRVQVRVRGLHLEEVRRGVGRGALDLGVHQRDDVAAAEELHGPHLGLRAAALEEVRGVELLDDEAVRPVDEGLVRRPRGGGGGGRHDLGVRALKRHGDAARRGDGPRVRQRHLGCGPVRHGLRQHSPDQLRKLRVRAGELLVARVRRDLEVLRDKVAEGVVEQRQLGGGLLRDQVAGLRACHQLVGDHAGGPHVHLAHIALALPDLRRHVHGGSDQLREALVPLGQGLERASVLEVRELDMAAISGEALAEDEDVVRLDVAVHPPRAVQL